MRRRILNCSESESDSIDFAMAISKKRKIDSSGGNVPKAAEMNAVEELEIDFEVFPLCGDDRVGVQQMLKQLFVKYPMNLIELADYLVQHNQIGSVLKQALNEDDEADSDDDLDDGTVFGVTHVVNLTVHKEIGCVKSLRTLVTSLIEDSATEPQLKSSLLSVLNGDTDENQLGFLINERFINIPAKISYPLYKSLFEEIEKSDYRCSKFILMSKIFKSQHNGTDVVVYSNIEDEIFVRHSSSNVDVNIELENDTGDEMVSYRKIMVIDATKIPLILTDLKTEIWSE